MPTKESEAICSLKQTIYKSAGTIVEVYSEPSATSKVELFTKQINGVQLSSISANSSVLNV